MKQYIVTLNFGKGSQRLRSLLVTGKMFLLLSLGSMAVVTTAGIGAIIHQQAAASPISSMKGFAANVPGPLFSNMLAMEMASGGKAWTNPIDGKQAASFLIRMLTDINASDPKSLLAREYPGFETERTALIRPGATMNASAEPKDHGVIEAEAGNNSNSKGQNTSPSEHTAAPPVKTVPKSNPAVNAGGQLTTGHDKVVFIYHSHNRESWIPELKNSGKDPSDAAINVTLLGKRLQQKLEAQGIGAQSSAVDYPSAIKDFNWVLSYKYSKETVKEAMTSNKKLTYFFDIHRDSQPRKHTTVTINGKSYAKVMFIVGQGNPNWRKNEQFANKIHEAFEKNYPGISRGIWGKTSANGNGEYNQSLSPNSIVIEVGGVDNTLEESYRTIDALAKTITGIYWDAEKVSAPKAS